MTVAGTRETVGSQVMQQTGIQCFNCKGYGHYAKECRKPKRTEPMLIGYEENWMKRLYERNWKHITEHGKDSGPVSPDESSSTGSAIGTGSKIMMLKFLNEIVYISYRVNQTIHIVSTQLRDIMMVDNLCHPRLAPDRKRTMTLDNESRSKLKKDYVEIVDQTWFKHTSDYFRVPTAHDMELLIKTLLMPLSIKSQNDSFRFEHKLKTEMHKDFEYVKYLENEVDELESEKADFSNMYDLLIEECESKDVTCSYLHSLSDLNAYAELQCLYLHKVKECDVVHKAFKQTGIC
ncbi:retrovirus-related pol polyprotein from transposon TNT 1-94 [Tanacetum coccineum]